MQGTELKRWGRSRGVQKKGRYALLVLREMGQNTWAMVTIFLIGSIASGKSLAARAFERFGAYRIDLDELAKSLYEPGSDLVHALADEFGSEVLEKDGSINRPALARLAFATPVQAAQLSALVLPPLQKKLAAELARVAAQARYSCIVVEMSVLLGYEALLAQADRVVGVTAPYALRRTRASARGMDPAEFDRRNALQADDETLRRFADRMIANEDGEVDLVKSVKDILRASKIEAADGSH
ncbi:dephospho-CoA kinase [Collinsella sp. AGMB00827]|uniref:Dephospho-CoA kinase n=1 Tax=Collinsella ureilytica TaxID=2869515 RepID=A0ABS7MLR9_9ACTN|nr:dephospho-CoA kinase [Collinsella urealyticum]MBY4798301.1 dephospho-CoA kinase [Collinsella urealyticum]